MHGHPKQIVTAGYDACGERYNAARAHDPSPELELLLEVLADDIQDNDEIDLGGRVLMPGFVDAHTHLFNDHRSQGQSRAVPDAAHR